MSKLSSVGRSDPTNFVSSIWREFVMKEKILFFDSTENKKIFLFELILFDNFYGLFSFASMYETLCGNFIIFPSVRLYVRSIFGILKVQNLPF